MSYKDEFRTIADFFDIQWNAVYDNVPICWPNKDFTRPQGPWVRFAIINGESSRKSLGGSCVVRYSGVIIIQVFSETNDGEIAALEMADHVCSMFKDGPIDNIRFMVPYIVDASRAEDNWYQKNINIAFYREEIENLH